MADVLVIDDDADIRSLLDVALSLDGHQVTTAPGGRAGILALRTATGAGGSPVVILDLQMPDIDGWQVLDEIRGAEDLAATPVVLCTVRASPDDVHRGWLSGCDAYLSKPFDLAAVSAEVAKLSAADRGDLLRRRSERQALRPS